jgi:molybdopterin converting factor small subunit
MNDHEGPLRVKFYGKLAGILGPELQLRVENPCTVASLRNRIADAHPEAFEALADRRVRACIGDTLVPDDHPIAVTDEVEFLAPVSGG